MALSKIIENSISDGAIASAKLKDFSAAVDLNGVELILDADQDTSITADTDDRIDFKIAGVEHISISNSSGDTVIKPMVDAKDIIFQQYDGNKVFEINDANFVSVGGNASAPGEIRLYEDTDLGSHYVGFKAGNNTASVSYVLPLADGTSGQALTTDSSGTLSWSTISANTPTSANGQALGSVALEWSDLYLADGGIVYFGNDQDITLTHNADTGLTLNGVLVATGITIGSAAITEAELEILDGANVTTAELNIIDGGTSATSTTVADADRVVMNDGGTMVQVAVTDLAAYFDDEITAMPNLVTTGALNSGSISSGFGTINTGSSTITTTGAITGGSLIADDVTVDGKVITMTGSTSDTATLTVGTNGTLDIVTTDDNAAAANIQITADGTAELAGTTVTLDSSGGITLDADGGTITFADAGSSLGTITSSGYSGTAAAATTVTVTDNESTNENNVLVFVAGADSDGGTGLGLESDGNLTYNPSTGTLSATALDISGNIDLGDNNKLLIGTGNDLEIYHDGSNSYIVDNGTGNLRLQGQAELLLLDGENHHYVRCINDGAVELFYDNAKKIETDANGVTITGTVATLISPNDGQGEIAFGDDGDANIGRIAYNHASNFLATVVNTTEYMRIHSNGVTSIPQGIALGVAVSANTASNVLDDYEEGTYNAVISGSTSGSFNMDSNDTLVYTKIGRTVHVQGYVGVSSGSVNGNLRISLPFTPTGFVDDGEYNFSSLMIQNTGNTNTGQKFLFLTGDAFGNFYKVQDDGTAGYMNQGDTDNTFQVAVNFTYISG